MSDAFDQLVAEKGATSSPSQGSQPQPQQQQQQGDAFDQLAAESNQPQAVQQPTGISRLWTLDNPDPNAPKPDNMQQLKDAAIGAGKTIAKGLGNIGDVATLGLTHLLPGSDKASAGIGAQGTALNPTNEDQKFGGYVGDAAMYELGGKIFDSLADLPLAERATQAAKAMKAAKDHPELAAAIGRAINTGGQAATGTLAATGNPKEAAEAGAAGGVVGAIAEPVANAVSKGVKSLVTNIPKETEAKLVDAIDSIATNNGLEETGASTAREAVSDLANQYQKRAQDVYQQLDEEAPGFQELKDKIAQYEKAYKIQLNTDPSKAEEIAGDLNEAKARMFGTPANSETGEKAVPGLINEDQQALWDKADADYSRFKALQRVQGKVNVASMDAGGNTGELQGGWNDKGVRQLGTGFRSLSNATRKGAPGDVLAKAFGPDADTLRDIVAEGVKTSNRKLATSALLGVLGVTAGAEHSKLGYLAALAGE